MKKFLKFLFYWCLPGLVMLPIGGCFTSFSHFMGSVPSTGELVVARALDVVTMPVQIVVFGPLLAIEYISANTGERGRRKREAKRRQDEIDRYKKMLSSDFTQVFRVEEFLSTTNTPARDALNEWLFTYGHCPPSEEIDRFAERLIASPEVALVLTSVFYQRNLSVEMKRKLCLSLVEFSRKRNSNVCSRVMRCADMVFSDEELKGLISDKQDETDIALKNLLLERAERRERERELEERRAITSRFSTSCASFISFITTVRRLLKRRSCRISSAGVTI